MDITNRLTGQVALVMGGSRGIGVEIVRRLAAEGADWPRAARPRVPSPG